MLELDEEHRAKVERALEKARLAKSQYNRRYYEATEADQRASSKRYYAENREHCLARSGAYYKANIEERLAYDSRYRAENKGKIAAKDKKYHENNKEKISTTHKAYYTKNKELISVKCKAYRTENKEMFKQRLEDQMKNPEFYKKKKITACKMRAKRVGASFDLTYEGIDWPTHCPVFGTLLVYAPFKNSVINKPSVPSIDRIDSTKGYTLGNVQVISMLANVMKNSATEAELKMFANWVLDS